MAEKRKKSMSILLLTSRKTEAKIDLFPASEWPDAPGVAPGLYRVRIDRKWVGFNGEKYSFMTLGAVMDHVELASMQVLGCSVAESGPLRPDITIGTPVRVRAGSVAGEPVWDLTRAATEPIQGIDGRWYVGVVMIGKGTEMVAVDTLRVG